MIKWYQVSWQFSYKQIEAILLFLPCLHPANISVKPGSCYGNSLVKHTVHVPNMYSMLLPQA